MKKTIAILSAYLFISVSIADIITIEHNITNLPPGGFVSIDLDDDGLDDINLASNFYISSRDNTEFTSSYSLLGDVIDINVAWRRGNTWPRSFGYVQDNHLYMAIRNTSIGNNYGYITYDYHPETDSVSLNSYTYEDTGRSITVASPVPEPSTVILFGCSTVSLLFFRSFKYRKFHTFSSHQSKSDFMDSESRRNYNVRKF